MDIVCLSHLRWDFVCQRPQHLMLRLASYFRVFYVEETSFNSDADRFIEEDRSGVHVVKMFLKGPEHGSDVLRRQQALLNDLITARKIKEYLLWYYTPMALQISDFLRPVITVYDCMDELSAFRFAPPALKELERQLMQKADIVFTGGHSLYNAKKHQHKNIHAFPSSIDKNHFASARRKQADPVDQQPIPHPRIGFYGVLDERFDIELVKQVAEKKPDWHLVLLGPVVKIDPALLPRRDNIHYLGGKNYSELPSYLAGWDIAMICFALNESTRFISPTKTPEYLAGGKPVISTPITDVVETYGKHGLVDIALSPTHFIELAEKELARKNKSQWLKKVDSYLSTISWDNTVTEMRGLLYDAIARKQIIHSRANDRIPTRTMLVMKDSLPAAS